MDAFLDDEIGESSKLLPDLLRGLRKKENLLQGQVQEMIHSIYVFMSLSMQWVCCLLFEQASVVQSAVLLSIFVLHICSCLGLNQRRDPGRTIGREW